MEKVGYWFIVIFITIGTLCVVGGVCYNTGYKQGQIDSHIGIIKYELVRNIDGTITWEYKEAQHDTITTK